MYALPGSAGGALGTGVSAGALGAGDSVGEELSVALGGSVGTAGGDAASLGAGDSDSAGEAGGDPAGSTASADRGMQSERIRARIWKDVMAVRMADRRMLAGVTSADMNAISPSPGPSFQGTRTERRNECRGNVWGHRSK
jgi:hypothetical protein